ncbi:MAG: paraquat-inducible protein A [Gammaproteobacteria bacterium]
MQSFRIIFYPAALALAFAVVSLSLDAARLNRLGSEQIGIDRSSELAWKSVLESLSFSLYNGASKIKNSVVTLFEESERRKRLAWQFAVALMGMSSIFGIFAWHRSQRLSRYEPFIADLIAVAIIFLGIGLVAPILSLKAYAPVPVIGEVILKYEVKSVLTTIGTLAGSQNLPVAILIAAFSVVTPLAKLLIAIVVLQRRWPKWHRRGLSFMKAIGKWSMADVFVVAVLVAYFAASGDEFSEAHLGVGLYFFAAYCLISQLATQLLARAFEAEIAATERASQGDVDGA